MQVQLIDKYGIGGAVTSYFADNNALQLSNIN
jgi:hypothetical protein